MSQDYGQWEDCCEHGEEAFIGAFMVYDIDRQNVYDLYLFHDITFGLSACIRYGNEAHEYISPGPVHRLANRDGLPVYKKAWELIEKKVEFSFKKKGEK